MELMGCKASVLQDLDRLSYDPSSLVNFIEESRGATNLEPVTGGDSEGELLLNSLYIRDSNLNSIVGLNTKSIHKTRRQIGNTLSILVRSPVCRFGLERLSGLRSMDFHLNIQQIVFASDFIVPPTGNVMLVRV